VSIVLCYFISCPYSFLPPPTPECPTLSLHDALPICEAERDQQQDRSQAETDEQNLEHDSASRHPPREGGARWMRFPKRQVFSLRSEEHTSELQSRFDLVCRLLLEKIKD